MTNAWDRIAQDYIANDKELDSLPVRRQQEAQARQRFRQAESAVPSYPFMERMAKQAEEETAVAPVIPVAKLRSGLASGAGPFLERLVSMLGRATQGGILGPQEPGIPAVTAAKQMLNMVRPLGVPYDIAQTAAPKFAPLLSQENARNIQARNVALRETVRSLAQGQGGAALARAREFEATKGMPQQIAEGAFLDPLNLAGSPQLMRAAGKAVPALVRGAIVLADAAILHTRLTQEQSLLLKAVEDGIQGAGADFVAVPGAGHQGPQQDILAGRFGLHCVNSLYIPF